jgi:peptidoglycan/LPS O-acetylase OafA/YrhL
VTAATGRARPASRSAPLDGIRALAVVAVLVFHAHYRWAVGGYLGVDVFFVLSGFLITRVLLSTPRSWRGYRDFLVRRAVRLLPALLVAMAGAALVLQVAGTDRERGALGRCTATSVGYLMNLPLAGVSRCGAMWHITWSLAAEQQFYLVWPLVLVGLTAALLRPLRAVAVRLGVAVGADVRDERWVVLSAAGVVTAALWLLAVGWQAALLHAGASTSRVAFSPDARSLVLLLGCALALLTEGHPDRRTRRRVGRADAAAALAVVALLLLVGWGSLGSGLAVIGPTVAGGLAALALVWAAAHASGRTVAARALGARPVAWLGRVSYSLYLWHEVAYRLAETVAPRGSATAEALRFVLALGFAAASYRLVELPAQRWWQQRSLSDAAASAGASPTARRHSPHRRPSRLPRRAGRPSTPAARR